MRSGTEIISLKDESSNAMPRWLEATSGFLKSSPSSPESSIANSGKTIQNGGGVLKVPLKSHWNKQDGSQPRSSGTRLDESEICICHILV